MSDADLQKATASETLTLEEEYAMQESWRTDADKLTFIACLPLDEPAAEVPLNGNVSCERMIGDINLFLFVDEDDLDDGVDDKPLTHPSAVSVIGEIELMIARKDLHRQGYGRAALLTFIDYILLNQNNIIQEFLSTTEIDKVLKFLRVKIDQDNRSSIGLFESVGFTRLAGGPNYFGEIEMRWQINENSLAELRVSEAWQAGTILTYTPSQHE